MRFYGLVYLDPMSTKVTIPEGYVRLDEACAISGKSEKTVRIWADRKQVGKRKWKGLALYRRSDLEAMAEKDAEVVVVQPGTAEPVQLAPAVDPQVAFAEFIAKLIPQPPPADFVPIGDKPRVTLKEAVKLGYRAETLTLLVREGKLENVGTPHRYRFRRRDLDAL